MEAQNISTWTLIVTFKKKKELYLQFRTFFFYCFLNKKYFLPLFYFSVEQ
jgi:hypothetical protein